MAKIFGIDIQAIVGKATKGKLLSATLHVVTPGTRLAADRTAGTVATEKTYSCDGLVEDYSDYLMQDSRIQVGDKKILLMAKSISNGTVVPKAGDNVTIEGAKYNILSIKRDPASATYTLHGRSGK